nr:glycosyltransferase [Thalassotalea sp. Y01]
MNAGGAEKWLLDFSKNIDKSRYEISFLYHTEAPQLFDSQIKPHVAKIHRLSNHKNVFSYLFKLKRLIAEENYQIIHSHVNHYASVLLALKLLTDVKVVVHCHNDLSGKVAKSPLWKRAYYYISKLLITKFSDFKIAVSDKASNSIFSSDKCLTNVRKVYCGIDSKSIDEEIDKESSKDEIYKKIEECLVSEVKKQPLVFHIGRFVEQKNHKFLFEVIKEAQQQNIDVKFCLFGDGPLFEYFLKEKERLKLKNCFLFGATNNMSTLLYKYASLMVLPSLHEGLPIVLMESQYLNVPTIVSNNVSKEADLGHSLVKYLEIDNVERWREAIIFELDSSPKIENRYKNQHFESSPFNVEHSVRDVSQIYNKLLAGGS